MYDLLRMVTIGSKSRKVEVEIIRRLFCSMFDDSSGGSDFAADVSNTSMAVYGFEEDERCQLVILIAKRIQQYKSEVEIGQKLPNGSPEQVACGEKKYMIHMLDTNKRVLSGLLDCQITV